MSYDATSQGMISDPFAATQDRTQQMIRNPIEIIQGSAIDDTDCTLQTIVVTYETVDHYGVQLKYGATNPHHLQRLAEKVIAAFDIIKYSSTSTFEPTTNVTDSLVLYNLGRLARETINDDTFMSTIIDLDEELSLSVNGVAKVDNELFAQDVAELWFAIGNGDDTMFGEWNFTQWKPEDDALAGVWIVWLYILLHWGVQCCTYFSSDFVRGIGDYATQGGAIEGRLKKLDPYNEKDWPLRYLSSVNGEGNVFGITAAMVDNSALKGIQIPLVDTVEPFIKKYFSRSRWIWRYMRWVDVTPIYTIIPPQVKETNAPALNSAYDDFDYMSLFSSTDDVDWDWWNTLLLNFTQRLQRFKFKGKNGGAFGSLKSRIKMVNVFDLPEPGTGKGGLFWHQMAAIRVDVDAVAVMMK